MRTTLQIFHAIRAWLWHILQMPFIILTLFFGFIAGSFAMLINENWWDERYRFNPFEIYRTIKKNDLAEPDAFNKWTGRRIK